MIIIGETTPEAFKIFGSTIMINVQSEPDWFHVAALAIGKIDDEDLERLLKSVEVARGVRAPQS